MLRRVPVELFDPTNPASDAYNPLLEVRRGVWEVRGEMQHFTSSKIMCWVAVDRGAHEATLEVRLSNLAARKLYEKYGFRPVGLRPRYYSDDGEDALIMTTLPLSDQAMRDRIERLRAELEASPAPSGPAPGPTTPTDPVVTSTVVTAQRVPGIVRHTLNLESGLNNGLRCSTVLLDSLPSPK